MAKIHFVYFDVNTGYFPGFHHGLAYIFGTLKGNNHDVSLSHIIEQSGLEKTREYLKNERFDLVALSFTTNQKKYARLFLNAVDTKTELLIAGGAYCSLLRDKVFEEFPELAAICVGEGEGSLKELCERIDNKTDYLNIPNLYFKTKEKVIKNSISPLQDINSFFLPDYTLFDYSKIISNNGGCFPMMLSRGCPYNCNYCCNHAFRQIYPNKSEYVRFPSVERAMNIIESNLRLYPDARKIALADDTFTLNKKWLLDFCKVYKEKIGLPFLCNARVETIDEEVARCLKDAGCISIDFGVETGNEWLRKYVLNRKHSNEQIKKVFRIIRKEKIKSFSFNMFGLPFETAKMAKETFDLNLELNPDFGKCFYFYPYPGTKLYEKCLEYAMLLDNIESRSGYLESPCLKETFITHKEIKKYFNLLQIFFYARLIFSKTKLPPFFEKMLLKIVFLFKQPILFFLKPATGKGAVSKSRNVARKFAMKFLR